MSEQILKDTDPNTFDIEKDDFCVVDGVRYEVAGPLVDVVAHVKPIINIKR